MIYKRMLTVNETLRDIDKKKIEANAITIKGLQREVVKVKKEMKMMRMGPVPGIEVEKKEFTDEEQRQHVRTGHALYDTRCELRVQTRGLARHPKKLEAETVNFDYAMVKSISGGEVHNLLIGGGPRGETFARRVPRKRWQA